MAITKKLRFEVFKRDGFRCGYCGKTPPEVILEVDHVQPKSKNGLDDIDNLLTACGDCNRGKAAILLSEIPPTLKKKYEKIKEAERQLEAYNDYLMEREKRRRVDIEFINQIFGNHFPGCIFKETFNQGTLRPFLKKLPRETVRENLDIACMRIKAWHPELKKGDLAESAIRYFCGICWRQIKGDHDV